MRTEAKKMETMQLYTLLKLPEAVIHRLTELGKEKGMILTQEEKERLLDRKTWEAQFKALKERLDEERDGLRILMEELEIVRTYSLPAYEEKEIPMEIFLDTMRFTKRFLEEEKRVNGVYRFTFDWWFTRQMSLLEFRIGALEYEWIQEDTKREIAVHIPGDADLRPESVQASLEAFASFRERFFPEWKGAPLTCLSWMMMPQLLNLLGEDSNVVRFMQRFEIEEIFEKETWYRDWIYPGFSGRDEDLPENTTLQRRLKKHLLEGKPFGVARGILRF